MSEDPILKLAVHLEKHRDHQQAFFSTRALRTLLDRLGAADGKLAKVTNERDTYKESWERLTVEKAQSSWGEFQRQGKMLKEAQAEVERLTKSNDEVVTEGLRLFRERDAEIEKLKAERDDFQEQASETYVIRMQRDELEAQVKRLLAKEGERIGKALTLEALNKRLDEPLPELGQPELPQS